ncbi:unnamed protein product, partial [Polarella glacialis]
AKCPAHQLAIAHIASLDLSRNPLITDRGIGRHLAPFLCKWSLCKKLRLDCTGIGDGGIQALLDWVAAGYPEELHLSDLCGQVSEAVIFQFLHAIHQRGRYPYQRSDGSWSSLWLRLDNNGLN